MEIMLEKLKTTHSREISRDILFHWKLTLDKEITWKSRLVFYFLFAECLAPGVVFLTQQLLCPER